jgi:hypothetical protein
VKYKFEVGQWVYHAVYEDEFNVERYKLVKIVEGINQYHYGVHENFPSDQTHNQVFLNSNGIFPTRKAAIKYVMDQIEDNIHDCETDIRHAETDILNAKAGIREYKKEITKFMREVRKK